MEAFCTWNFYFIIFIMEDQTYNNMDVDDLFGDSEPVALPNMNTLPAPPVKGLPEKLDELSSNGCNS